MKRHIFLITGFVISCILLLLLSGGLMWALNERKVYVAGPGYGGRNASDVDAVNALLKDLKNQGNDTGLYDDMGSDVWKWSEPDMNLTAIDFSGIDLRGDLNITGFKHLSSIKLNNSGFTSLYVGKCKELKKVEADNTELVSLVIKNSGGYAPSAVSCNNGKLETLDVSGFDRLSEIDCSNNKLKELNISGVRDLDKLDCSGNLLTELDISSNPFMTRLNCLENPLKTLIISSAFDWEDALVLKCGKNVGIFRMESWLDRGSTVVSLLLTGITVLVIVIIVLMGILFTELPLKKAKKK